MARPTILNKELIENLCKELKEGLPVKYACDLYKITQPSFNNWLRQGEADILRGEDESIYSMFFLEIKKAQAQWVSKALQDIRTGRQGWQGVSWVLERTRQDFMPKQEIKAGEDGKVNVILNGKVREIKKGELQKDGTIR